MSTPLLARAARRSLGQIRYVSPVPPRAAGGLVARVYAQAERDFGMLAPPLALHSPAPAPLAAAWLMLRETLLVSGRASRAKKEAVAAAVSAVNACPYCVSVHTAARRVAAGRTDEARGARLGEIAPYARCSSRPDPQAMVPAADFAELAGVAVTFHYLNRMVNVFLPDSLLPPHAPKVMAAPVLRMLSSVMLAADAVPAAALDLLPAAQLPADLAWAAGEPRVAAALGRAAAAIGEVGDRVVPREVRELVLHRLSRWDGQPPGPSRAWADEAVAGLAAADRAAGRLALLTALASYQVGPADVDDLRPCSDEELIGLTSWASLAAARRIGSWLADPSAANSHAGRCPAVPAADTVRDGQPSRQEEMT